MSAASPIRATGALLALAPFGLLCAMALLAFWLSPHITALAEAQIAHVPTRLEAGGFIDLVVAGLRWTAWACMTILLQPLILIVGAVLVELALGGDRKCGRFWLTCLCRASLYISIYVFSTFLGRSAHLLPLPNGIVAQAIAAVEPLNRVGGPVLLLLLLLIAKDFVSYWVHRAFHHFPLLWRFHAVHHSTRNLSAWNNLAHPFEAVFQIIPLFLIGMLIGSSGLDAAGLFLLVAFHTDYLHMSAPVKLGFFGAVIVDNQHHFLHHSRDPADYNRNFGTLFKFWDVVFGTYKKPPALGMVETGIAGYQGPQTLQQYLLMRLPADTNSVPDRPVAGVRGGSAPVLSETV